MPLAHLSPSRRTLELVDQAFIGHAVYFYVVRYVHSFLFSLSAAVSPHIYVVNGGRELSSWWLQYGAYPGWLFAESSSSLIFSSRSLIVSVSGASCDLTYLTLALTLSFKFLSGYVVDYSFSCMLS